MKLTDLKIVHGALIGGVLLYAGLATFLVVGGFDGFGVEPPIPIEYAGAGVLLLMVGGTVVRRKLIAQVSPVSTTLARLSRPCWSRRARRTSR